MAQQIHPTKTQLIKTTVEILETKFPQDVAVDEILDKSGISKGSLYHHFDDLGELLEEAQIARFAEWVDRSIGLIVPVLSAAKTREDIIAGLKNVTTYTQSSEYRGARFSRARVLANSETSERFKKKLGMEQDRLTTALEDLVSEAKNKGLFNEEIDSRVVAVFIQSYTLGKIVDDIVPTPIPQQNWDDFILNMLIATMVKH